MTMQVRILLTGLAGGIAMFFWGFGLTAAIMINIPHWNWYGFPTAFTVAEMFEHVVGQTLVGIIAALIMKPGTVAQPAQSGTPA